MSFKCFFSYFIGALSLLLGQRFYIWYGNPVSIGLCLTAGFVISQIVCYSVHQIMKEKHDIETKLNSDDFWK